MIDIHLYSLHTSRRRSTISHTITIVIPRSAGGGATSGGRVASNIGVEFGK